MIKLLGAVLLIASCTGVGLRRARALNMRVCALRDAVSALETVRGEITTNLTPLPELAQELAEIGPKLTRSFFGAVAAGLSEPDADSFPVLWTRCLRGLESCSLHDEELSALGLLGAKLGRFDVSEQGAAIDRCIVRLETCLRDARAAARTDGKLSLGLGLAAGLTLCVLFL